MSDFTAALKRFSPLASGSPDQELTLDQVSKRNPAPAAPVAPAPDQALADSIAQIRAANADPVAMAVTTLSQDRNNTLTQDNVLLQDWQDLTPGAFRAKHGAENYNSMIAYIVGGGEVRRRASTERTAGEITADSLIGIGSGALQGVGSLTALGAGVISDDAGVVMSEAMQGLKGYTNGLQSDTLNEHRFVDSLRTTLDKQDNQKAFEADKNEKGEFYATIRSFGRGAINGGGRLIEDPMMATDLIAEGAGSMLVGGPAARGVGLVGKGLASLGAKKAGEAVAKAAFPIAIGAMEGGGAYQQTIQEIMTIPDAELKAQSPEYAQMRETMTERDAKVELATDAGLTAAAITAPLAAVAGKVAGVEKLETAPIRGMFTAPREAAGNIVRETVEEGLQSGVGETAGNIGTRLSGANPNQDLAEGVGDAMIQGAVAGAGSAAGLQAPGIVARGTAEAAMATGRFAVDQTLGRLRARADAVRAETAASSPVSETKVAEAVVTAAEEAPAVAESLRTLAAESVPAPAPDATPEQVQKIQQDQENIETFIQRVEGSVQIQNEDYKILPRNLRQAVNAKMQELQRPLDRFEALVEMAKIARDENQTEDDRVSAGIFLLDQFDNQDKLFNEDVPAFLNKVPHDRPEYQVYDRYQKILNTIRETPSIQQAMTWAQEELDAPEIAEDADLSTPEGQQLVQNVVGIARHAPANVNPASVDVILKQAKDLTPEQQSILRSAAALARSGIQAAEIIASGSKDNANENFRKNGIDFVKAQVEVGGGKGLSLQQHFDAVMKPALRGDTKAAKLAAHKLARFAQSHRNKVEAYNEAIASNDASVKVAYQAAAQDGKWLPKDGKQSVWFRPGNANSERLARQVYAEAKAAENLVSAFTGQYPEFNLPKVAVPVLNLSVQGGSTTAAPQVKQSEPPVTDSRPAQEATAAPVETETKPATTQDEVPPSQEEASTVPQERGKQAEPAVGAVEQAGDSTTGTETEVRQETAEETKEEIKDDKPKNVIQKITEAFPKLIQPEGRNFIHEIFSFPKEQLSRLLGSPEPLLDAYNLVRSAKKLEKVVGSTPPASVLSGYERLFIKGNDVLREIEERLAGHKAINQHLRDGKPANRYANGKMLNILEEIDGNYQYNAQFIQSSILAGLDWVLNGQSEMATLSPEDLAASLGIGEVPAGLEQVFNRGVSVEMAKQQIAQRIVEFWGLKVNRSVDMAYVKGITEGVAAEVLAGMNKAGLIQHVVHEEFIPLTGKSYGRIYFDNRSDEINEILKDISGDRKRPGTKKLIGEIALIKPVTKGASVGRKITEVARTQLRNRLVKNTPQQIKAIQNKQDTPHLPNTLYFDFMDALGEDNYVLLRGATEYKEGALNRNHEKSLEGVNRGLRSSYQAIQDQMMEVFAYADTNNIKDIETIPSYYPREITRVGRMQMVGQVTPQGDKDAREVFMPTRSVLDLTNPDQLTAFWLTNAQGLGVKTEKVSHEEAIAQVQAKVNGQYKSVIQELKHWVKARNAGKEQPIGRELVDEILAAAKGSITAHGIHSLLAVAKLQVLEETGGDKSKFVHFNYLEADGKTNGPINALMLMATGAFNKAWLKAVGKGGVYFGAKPKTLNDHIATGGENAIDLYGEGSAKAQVHLAEFRQGLNSSADKGAAKVAEQMDRLFRVLSALNVDIKFDGENVIIDRGVTKNPLTITIYGSGVDGIAGKVTSELVDLIYAKMSDYIAANNSDSKATFEGQTYEGFWSDLNALTSQRAVYLKKTKGYDLWNGFKAKGEFKDDRTAQGYTIHPHQFKTLKENIRTLFVDHLAKAIDETVMVHVSKTTDTIQEATQIQSIVMRAVVRRAIIEKLAEKKRKTESDKGGSWRDGDFLSENEINDIIKKHLPYGASFSTGTQSYFLGGSEQTDDLGRTDENGEVKPIHVQSGNQQVEVKVPAAFSRGINNDFTTAPMFYMPGLAGVKAVPSTVIGSGDGQMMLNAAVNDKIEKVLDVYDGLNMSADKIADYSKMINQHVHETWVVNPVRAILESFQEFMKLNPFTDVLDTTKTINVQSRISADVSLEMTKVITGNPKPEGRASAGEIQAYVETTLADLKRYADEIDARQAVFKKFPMSVDQMASGKSPYVHAGSLQIQEDATEDQLLEAMNAEYRSQMAARGYAEFEQEIEPAEGDLPHVIQATALKSEIPRLVGAISAHEKGLLNAAADALAKSGYRVVLGTRDQVEPWLQNNYDRYRIDNLYNANGFMDPIAKIIAVVNLEAHTVVHELIHATTYEKLTAYYANPNSVSDIEGDAIKRTEGLMDEWLAQDFSDESELARSAQRLAVHVIRGHQKAGQKEAALNEFMAWVLTNQHLARVAQKTKVQNPLFKIMGKALQAIKQLIWGSTKDAPKAGESMLGQLRFNTRILMALPSQVDDLKTDYAVTTLYQSAAFGSNDRITELRAKFQEKIAAYIESGENEAVNAVREFSADLALIDGNDTARLFAAKGLIENNMQAISTFADIQAALAVEAELNPNALTRIEEIYAHVIDTLKVEDLMADRVANSGPDRAQANEKLEVLQGVYGIRRDEQGRTNLMSSFLALAMIDDRFRSILQNMEMPKAAKVESGTLDAHLSNLGMEGMDRLSRIMAGEKGADVKAKLDSLTANMLANVGDQRAYIEKQAENGIEAVDRYLANNIQDLAEKAVVKSQEIIDNNSNPLVQNVARMVRFAGEIVNEKRAEEVTLGVTRWLNGFEGAHGFRALANSAIGRTRENATVYDMISLVRSAVQQTRQIFRRELPKTMADKFTRKLEAAEQTAMFKAIAKTDLAALHGTYGISGSLALVTDANRLSGEISGLEREVTRLAGHRATQVLEKTRQLAHYLNTGEHGVRLLRNAYAVAHLFGEAGRVAPGAADPLVEPVDRLSTLYALQALDQSTKETLARLVQDQQAGLSFALSYLVGLRKDEQAKSGFGDIAQYNHYKGYVPSEGKEGVSLVVAGGQDHDRLLSQGYIQLGEYQGSSADRSLGRQHYYFSPVSGRAAYSQGVMQTVHQTVSGVDPNTGYTTGEMTAGRITDPQIVQLVTRQINQQRNTAENLLPVFDANGRVVAYERSVDPAQLTRLERSTDLAKMTGVWAGRVVEERLADEFNKVLVDNLKGNWDDGKKTNRTGEYVDLSRLPRDADPLYHEAWRLIPHNTKDYIKAVFGNEGFRVRKDMILDAVGERNASVADLFTGKTRWKPGVQKLVTDIALSIYGNKAFGAAVQTEKFIQDAVMNAKVLIVVKSVVVPAANLVANIFQMLNRGVPLRHVIKGLGAKTAELNFYIKSRAKEITLDAELKAAIGANSTARISSLRGQIQSIRDSYKRLSIHPLIQAGEFSAISDGEVTAEDLALAEGKWSNYVEKIASKIPNGLKTPYRYALVTRDTALFQGLAKATQYGDFLGKAILYDDLTKRKGMAKKDAIAQVNEAFVNYNRLSGRNQQYLESIGLLWFPNYKIRIMKEAAYLMRHHPLRSLITMGLASDTPQGDNALSQMVDGRLDNALGPWQGLHAFSLNPWVNLTN